MRILLDECVTKKIKPHLSEFDVFTVSEMQWNGIKNGKLMTLCVENNFDILLTIDKNLAFQQNIENYPISIVVLDSLSSKIEDITKCIPAFKLQATSFQKRKAYIIDCKANA